RVVLVPFSVSCRRQRGKHIYDRGFAMPIAVRLNANLERHKVNARSDQYITNTARFGIELGHQPNPLLPLDIWCGKDDTFALCRLRWINKTRVPTWRPFGFAHRAEERRRLPHRALQKDCERLCLLRERCGGR